MKTLKEFRCILLRQQIKVHTDHENLTYKKFNSDRVMRWRLFIEEYSPDLRYVKGKKNVVADAMSRLEIDTPHKEECHYTVEDMAKLYTPEIDSEVLETSKKYQTTKIDTLNTSNTLLGKIVILYKTKQNQQSIH